MRGNSPDALAAALAAAGLRPAGEARAGDLVAMSSGPGQLHLGIFTGAGFVHCDAGLGRVVERPAPIQWPILGAWRAMED